VSATRPSTAPPSFNPLAGEMLSATAPKFYAYQVLNDLLHLKSAEKVVFERSYFVFYPNFSKLATNCLNSVSARKTGGVETR
jgi:hypothetical protein